MKRKTIKPWLIAASLLVVASLVWAGTSGKFTCHNPRCGYQEQVSFGGGFRFHQITGYCVHCQKFVYLSWSRPRGEAGADPGKAPKPIGKIWDPGSGRTLEIYACPTCSGPFSVTKAEDMKHCPKCGGDADFKPTLMYD